MVDLVASSFFRIQISAAADETHDHLQKFSSVSLLDRVAQNQEIILTNFLFSTRRTRILMRLIIYYLVLIVNPIGRILVR